MTLSQTERRIIESSIRDIEDFPKPGIIFKDITTLLNDREAYGVLMNHLYQRYKEYNLDYIAGIDARGFIFGAALAQMLN
ncbi:MAG: adenine phosphoribosyltransferase, partial [Sulfurimonas sp.]|nr:adenine phosphoribosyltransferase [Sulfurimonas sp.]